MRVRGEARISVGFDKLRAGVHEEWPRRHHGLDELWGLGGPPIAVQLQLEARLANLG